MERNDHTFIERLEIMDNKYMKLSCKHELTDTWSGKYFRLYLLFSKAIKDIKEDMRLRAIQRLISIDMAGVKGFTKEDSESYYAALDSIYKPIGINIGDIT